MEEETKILNENEYREQLDILYEELEKKKSKILFKVKVAIAFDALAILVNLLSLYFLISHFRIEMSGFIILNLGAIGILLYCIRRLKKNFF